MNVSFTLHTELRALEPEFTVSCLTRGGPATTVHWVTPLGNDTLPDTSQVILNTYESVYENRLRVRGRESGTYSCTVKNEYFPTENRVTKELAVRGLCSQQSHWSLLLVLYYTTVAGAPTYFSGVISGSNTTQYVNVTVSWESPEGDVSGYMIYYQTEGGPVISDKVSGGGRETHSLDGLQRGVTYSISILALSQHLPSPLVGPVSVYLHVTPRKQHSITMLLPIDSTILLVLGTEVCTDDTEVITGGLGGAMGVVIVGQSLIILILLRPKRHTKKKKLSRFLICTNTTYTLYSIIHVGPQLWLWVRQSTGLQRPLNVRLV